MIKYILDFFRKRPQTLEETLLYPEGKRHYKEAHGLKKTQMDEDALKIIHRLSKFGHKSYLVGGCVRDLLLGRKPKDFDIATSATPGQIKNIFNNCRIIGKRFKIVHIIFKGKIIEVTTFRSLPDHRLSKKDVSETDLLLKRDNNFGTSKEDAARRDFTVNALYYDPRNESIIDYVGGYEDIKNKILRVVGDPDISFKEDPVRMLRAVKISVLHGLEIEKKTKQAIKKHKNEIEKASTSRMLEEYNKIFRTWDTANIFRGLAENHLLEVLFKEAFEPAKRENANWQDKFFDTNPGKLLVIADRKLKEREELTSTIFFALLFSDLVNEALEKEKGNMIPVIKAALDPICNRLDISRKDRDRLIKIYASQKRFMKANESNQQHNELFRAKDFFYESFMYFKITSEAKNHEEALQAAFFWEISTRIRPGGKPVKNHHTNQNHTHKRPEKEFQAKEQNREEVSTKPSSYPSKENFRKGKHPRENQHSEKKQHHGSPKEQHSHAKHEPYPIKEKKTVPEEEPEIREEQRVDIVLGETTKIVTTAEMEALKEEIPDEEKIGNEEKEKLSKENPDSSESASKIFKKRRFKPKKFRKFYKKKFPRPEGNSPGNEGSPKTD